MKLLQLLPFLALTTAIAPQIVLNASQPVPETATPSIGLSNNLPLFPSIDSPPRLVMYVQTFHTPDGKPLSLLPLLEHETKVTHIILASAHLHETPGQIRLNNDRFDDPTWDVIWEEVKVLQENGVKVMLLLGGAAAGTYGRLNGTDTEVSLLFQSRRTTARTQNLYHNQGKC